MKSCMIILLCNCRAIEVYNRYKVPMSNLYEAQHVDTQSERAVSGPLRYTDTCIFWIQCNQDGKICVTPKH